MRSCAGSWSGEGARIGSADALCVRVVRSSCPRVCPICPSVRVGRRRARAGASGNACPSVRRAPPRRPERSRARATRSECARRHDAEKRAMTHRATSQPRMQRVETVLRAPARDGPARRRAGHRALARRHARRREPRQRHAGGDRHADRARRQRRPGHAGLAVPRRPGVLRGDAIAMTAAARGHRARRARGARQQPLRHARPARHGRRRRRRRVGAGPRDVRAARCASPRRGVAPERLRALVEDALPLLADPERGRARDAGRRCASTSTPAEPRWTRCPKPCASCAWSARSSSTAASPRPGATSRRRADAAAPLLEPGAERVVIFHLITEGECFVEIGDGSRRCA